jgi:predicted Zn-dependent protease
MTDKENARALIHKIGSQTKHYATVVLSEANRRTTRFANSEITQSIAASDATVTLTLHNGKKEATCTTNVLTDEGLRKLVQSAEDRLPFVPAGEHEAFVMSAGEAREAVASPRLAAAFGTHERVAIIKAGVDALEEGFAAAGALSLDNHGTAVGDNRGAFRYGAYSMVCFNTVVTHQSGAAGGAQCGSVDDVPDIAAAFCKAQATAKKAVNPIEIQPGVYTVVLSPYALCDLMEFVAHSLNAKEVCDGRSFAVGQLGTKLFGDNISLKDDVHHSGTLPMYFDVEGNVRKAVHLIDRGVVNALLYDNKTAAACQTASTGHAQTNKGHGGFALNLVLKGGTKTLDEIIAHTQRGIFVSELHYTNFVNPRALQITGLTRNGTFLIENGKLTRPVATLRFTQDLIQSLNQVTAFSVDRAKIVSPYGVSFMPGARLEGFCFSGKA